MWPETNQEFSIIKFISDMPKPVARFLAEIDLNLPRGSNIAHIGSPKDSPARSKAFKVLRRMQILKKAGKNMFMISPKFRIPPGGRVIDEVHKWNSLDPTEDQLDPPRLRQKEYYKTNTIKEDK